MPLFPEIIEIISLPLLTFPLPSELSDTRESPRSDMYNITHHELPCDEERQ